MDFEGCFWDNRSKRADRHNHGTGDSAFYFFAFFGKSGRKMAGKAPEGTNYGAEDSTVERRQDA